MPGRQMLESHAVFTVSQQLRHPDVMIRNVTVISGHGDQPPFLGNVAIKGGVITAVATCEESIRSPTSLVGFESPGVIINGTGLTLTPGFIDAGAADEYEVVHTPDMPHRVEQGCTTVIVGQHGITPQPIASRLAAELNPGHALLPPWHGAAGYMEHIESNPSACNVAVLISAEAIHEAAHVDMQKVRKPSAKEQETKLRHMKALTLNL